MDKHKKNRLISRLLSGVVGFKFCGQRYTLCHPSLMVLQEADELYYQTLDDNKFGIWLKQEDIDKILLQQGVLHLCIDERMKHLEELLDNCKIELYENFFKSPQVVRRCEQHIINATRQFETAIQHKYSLNHWTVYSHATNVKNQYIVMKTLCLNGKRVYVDDMDLADVYYPLLDMGVMTKVQTYIANKDLRYLARNEPWQSLWNTGKPNPFKWHILELSDEHKLLLTFSRMYDGIYSGLDAPPEEIINNNDALDGWLIVQRRKREREKTDSKVQSSLSSKQQGATEVFLPVNSAKDAKKINQLNSPQGQVIKQQRAHLIKNRGKVKEGEFIDKQLDAQVTSNKQFKEHMKK